MAPTSRRWRARCDDLGQTRTQARSAQSDGGGTGAGQTRECASAAKAGARRGDHRHPKKSCGPAGYSVGDAPRQRRRAMMDAVVALAPASGLTAGACTALNVSRASVYRRRADLARPPAVRRPRSSPRRALATVERQAVLEVLRTVRFADQAPAEVYASLLDEGVYHCLIRNMYRILAAGQEVGIVPLDVEIGGAALLALSR